MKKIKSMIALALKQIINPLYYINHKIYMKFYIPILKYRGIKIKGKPIFISNSVHFDGPNLIELNDKCVISLEVLLLTHDYSISRGIESIKKLNREIVEYKKIVIGENSFIGAKSIIMPGTIIGKNCIIGAGSVIKGKIEDNSIVVGNPGKKIKDTKEWALEKFIQMELDK